MEKELFYMGILVGMTFMQGILTQNLQQKNKPYIRAFSYLMFGEAVAISAEVALYYVFEENQPEPLIAGLDYALLPFFFVEVVCLAYQDVKTLSWNKRWGWGLVMAIPLIIYFSIVIATGQNKLMPWMYIYFIAYVSITYVLMFYHIRKFHKRLRESEKKKEGQDLKWVIIIVLLMTVQYTMYTIYELLPDCIIYFSASYLLTYLHGYYIHKQVPTDFKKMKTTSAELAEQQKEAIDELKDATNGLKHKLDMDTAIKSFRVEHPSFDTRLRNMTETKLTKRDIILCCLIYEGKKIPEIAEYLGISPASVEVARHRLRNKLNIEKGANMQKIIRESIG